MAHDYRLRIPRHRSAAAATIGVGALAEAPSAAADRLRVDVLASDRVSQCESRTLLGRRLMTCVQIDHESRVEWRTAYPAPSPTQHAKFSEREAVRVSLVGEDPGPPR
jgi:hypothetical protein